MTASGRRPEELLVLVVDDDPGVVSMLCETLKLEGFRVAQAVDGGDALDKIAGLKPDLILLDLMLPGYGGFEVIQEIKAGPQGKTPVIVITGRFSADGVAAQAKAEPSVVAVFDKPIRPSELAGAVHKALKTAPPKRS